MNFGAGYGPRFVAAADLDGDGDPDLAVANLGSDSVSLLINKSPHPFSRDCNSNGVPDECEPDSNGDGSPDDCETPFIRGDADASGEIDLTDIIFALEFLFLDRQNPPCRKAADADGNGETDITDCVFTLSHLFLGGRAMPPPYPDCGIDPAPDDISCGRYPPCRG